MNIAKKSYSPSIPSTSPRTSSGQRNLDAIAKGRPPPGLAGGWPSERVSEHFIELDTSFEYCERYIARHYFGHSEGVTAGVPDG